MQPKPVSESANDRRQNRRGYSKHEEWQDGESYKVLETSTNQYIASEIKYHCYKYLLQFFLPSMGINY